MNKSLKISLYGLLFILASLQQAFATLPLVDTQWLAKNINDKSLLFVDLRPKPYFEYANIVGSVNTEYEQWRQPQNNILQKMLPKKDHIEKLLSQLGATPDSHIILVGSGESADDLAAVARIYWTLEQIGHDKKSIMDGGIIAYANARLPLQRGPAEVKTSKYTIKQMKNDQINADDISKMKDANLIDVRLRAEHLGIYLGAPDEKPGTIPQSESLPYDWFSQNGSGRIAKRENLELLMSSIDFDSNKPTVVFCHTGHRAALSWFVLHEVLGKENTALYDASFREWGTRRDLPVTQKLGIQH